MADIIVGGASGSGSIEIIDVSYTLLANSWSESTGYYSYTINNLNITTDSLIFIDIILDNFDMDASNEKLKLWQYISVLEPTQQDTRVILRCPIDVEITQDLSIKMVIINR